MGQVDEATKKKLIFLGSPVEVNPILQGLISFCHNQPYELVLVISQPARPKGRSKKMCDSPVIELAKSLNLKTYQPENINDPLSLDLIQNLNPDLMITAAYGQILSQKLIDIPKFGIINIHPSMLPKYRGATPIESVILDGEITTGITILKTVKKLDAGPIILQVKKEIFPDETSEKAKERLFQESVPFLCEAILKIFSFTAASNFLNQDDTQATFCHKISKEDGKINWQLSAQEIYNRYRAYYPWPGSFTFLNEQLIQLTNLKVMPSDSQSEENQGILKQLSKLGSFTFCKPLKGLIIKANQNDFLICTRLKPSGKNEMDAPSFFNGLKVREGLFFE